jgi:arsenite oxidase small subunit
MSKQTNDTSVQSACMTRRAFLFGGSAAVAGTVLLPGLPGLEGKALAAEVSRYPRKRIGSLKTLQLNQPAKFNYPDEAQNSNSLLFRLDAAAGGGIGPDQNVVAFNALCTHMGGLLDGPGSFSAADQALGPCLLHQTSFDLTRHGMVIGGHATESLPQVLLELEGDDIYAVGMLGLIYGRYDNLNTG